jgi:ATP-dependent RNA helicase DOB1
VVELIFTGLLNTLTIEQSIALLSCLIFDERLKDNEDPTEGLNKFLSAPFFKLQEIARSVAKTEASCGINVNEEEFVGKLNPKLYVFPQFCDIHLLWQ